MWLTDKKKNLLHDFLRRESVVLILAFIFVFFNWFFLVDIEKLAHPDYYVYHRAAEKLFSGDFKLGFIPPLFPFLLGLLGRLWALLPGGGDPFITTGRLVSLAAGLGVVFFTYRLLRETVGHYAGLGVVCLVISPFFLKLVSIPQTDMLYLFFVCAACYFFWSPGQGHNRLKHVAWAVLGGVLTRFEGVLLIASAFICRFKSRPRAWLYTGISALSTAGLAYLFFLKFAPRLLDKVVYVVSGGHYLFYFRHPEELARLFYGNFLFFIPAGIPTIIKWILFCLLLAAVFFAVSRLFKINRRFTLGLLFYELVFIIFKGYTASLDPEVEFRRMLSVIWIFFILAFVGVYYFFKAAVRNKPFAWGCAAVLAVFLVAVLLSQPLVRGTALLLFLPLIPLVIGALRRRDTGRWALTAVWVIAVVVLAQVYFNAGKRSYRYVARNTAKGGYAISQWLNQAAPEGDVLVYSQVAMVRYYLEQPIRLRHFYFKDEKIYNHRQRLIHKLLRTAKYLQIKYVAFDEFLNPEEGQFRVAIQNMLYEEKEKLHRDRDYDGYFHLVKTLMYKGRPVAWVLKPRYEKLPLKRGKTVRK